MTGKTVIENGVVKTLCRMCGNRCSIDVHVRDGKMVEIDHGNGFKTRYAHLRKVKVKRGQMVQPGDILGEMGCTGRCISTHLHYEVFFNNNLRNPLPFMEAPEDVQQTKREALATAGKGK